MATESTAKTKRVKKEAVVPPPRLRTIQDVLAEIQELPPPYGYTKFQPSPHVLVSLVADGEQIARLPGITEAGEYYKQWPAPCTAIPLEGGAPPVPGQAAQIPRPKGNLSGNAGLMAEVLVKRKPDYTYTRFKISAVPSCCGALHLHGMESSEYHSRNLQSRLDVARAIVDMWVQYTYISAIMHEDRDMHIAIRDAGWQLGPVWVRKDTGRVLRTIYYVSGT